VLEAVVGEVYQSRGQQASHITHEGDVEFGNSRAHGGDVPVRSMEDGDDVGAVGVLCQEEVGVRLDFRGGENLFVELSGDRRVLSCYWSSEGLHDGSVLSFKRVEGFIIVSFEIVAVASDRVKGHGD
jgi:hypothetical protein